MIGCSLVEELAVVSSRLNVPRQHNPDSRAKLGHVSLTMKTADRKQADTGRRKGFDSLDDLSIKLRCFPGYPCVGLDLSAV